MASPSEKDPLILLLRELLPKARFHAVFEEIAAGTIDPHDYAVNLYRSKSRVDESPSTLLAIGQSFPFKVQPQVSDLTVPLFAVVLLSKHQTPTKDEREALYKMESDHSISHRSVTYVVKTRFSEAVEQIVEGSDATAERELRRKVVRGTQEMRHIVHLVHQLVAALKHQFHRELGDYHPRGKYKHVFHRYGSKVFGRGSLGVINGGDEIMERALTSYSPDLAKLVLAKKSTCTNEDEIVAVVADILNRAGPTPAREK